VRNPQSQTERAWVSAGKDFEAMEERYFSDASEMIHSPQVAAEQL